MLKQNLNRILSWAKESPLPKQVMNRVLELWRGSGKKQRIAAAVAVLALFAVMNRNGGGGEQATSSGGLALAAQAQENLEALRKAAEAGNASAQARLGMAYDEGQGVAEDKEEAVKWYRRAAEQGDAIGQAGVCRASEIGRIQDRHWCEKAAKALPDLADRGDAWAQFLLGAMYVNGLGGLPKDGKEAVAWYRKAAEQGLPAAQYNLGIMYSEGSGGLPKDEMEAVAWYRKAAEQGFPDAQNILGYMYEKGVFGLPKDEKEAVVWYRKAAEQGDKGSEWTLTQMAERGNDEARRALAEIEAEERRSWQAEAARRWGTDELRGKAERGDVEAQAMLGMAYRYGGRGLLVDDGLAGEWFRKAAEKKHDVARCELGAMLWNGNGLRKDEKEAEKWCGPAAKALQKAAQRGDAAAQRNVGRMHRLGLALPKDLKEAAAWLNKAADQGDAPAQYELGAMYYKGEGLPKDYAQASAWLNKAAAQGHAGAQYGLALNYRYGLGLDKDNKQSEVWARRAAEQGLPEAQILMGWINDGLTLFGGVPDAARKWYDRGVEGLDRAAKRGDPNAMYLLSLEYRAGRSVREDAAQAAVWQLKAEEQLGADTVEKWLKEGEEHKEWKWSLF